MARQKLAELNLHMEKNNNWLSSENDRKVFFNALLNPPEPNNKLKQAMKRQNEFKSKE